MTQPFEALDVTIIGGGMITNDVILPTVYHLQRIGRVKNITVVGRSQAPLRALKENVEILEAFPGQDFRAMPSLDGEELSKEENNELFKKALAELAPRQLVIIALPDQLHYSVVKATLEAGQHILCVKPFTLKYDEAVELEKMATERGLFVGVEYHKRFDRRALIAKRQYQMGHFGEFVIGEAKMIEPYLYRFSNFQNWFTADETDPFVYVGCHYTDQVTFITGLKPTAVSVAGVKKKFDNGSEAYMWSSGRVTFENGSILTLTNGLGYPDLGGGGNDQGLIMYCEGDGQSGLIEHDDQFRGCKHQYVDKGHENKRFNYINPDFFRYIVWEGEGSKPIGYGYDSVAATILKAGDIEGEVAGLEGDANMAKRKELIAEVDAKGLIATPVNSSYNELVHEAARLSIADEGALVKIVYGDNPHVVKKS